MVVMNFNNELSTELRSLTTQGNSYLIVGATY